MNKEKGMSDTRHIFKGGVHYEKDHKSSCDAGCCYAGYVG